MTRRLDEARALLEQPLRQAPFEAGEHLDSDNSSGGLGPYHVSTIKVNGKPITILGVTQPEFSPQSASFVQLLSRRARARKVKYLILSNQNETILQSTPARDGEQSQILRRYPPLQVLSESDESLSPPERLAFTNLAEKIATDLLALSRDGQLDLIEPDADYFVDRLTRAVETLKPAVKRALITQFGIDPRFAEEVLTWAIGQGIPADIRSPDFAEAVVRQAIYRLLGKIIFYQSLRRAIPTLPEMDLSGLDTSQVIPRLQDCFTQAHRIDYHAVFREDVLDRLPFPASASEELRDLVGVLNQRDFAHLPQDVVGAVFERLIPPEDRHALGQFFTPENLVDLILAFCVRQPDDLVMDPTCGTGTFLIRAYDRKRTALGLHDHGQQLSQLWGIDIAPFPAELTTINLFRQQVDSTGNFPRVLNEDFFNVVPGGRYRFPPIKQDDPAIPTPIGGDETGIMVPIPQFDAIVGNFPYISADRIEQREKGYLAKIARRLAEEWFQAYPNGFEFQNPTQEREHNNARLQGLPINGFLEKVNPIISTFADLYISLFWHAAAFLKPGGRMGIVTSNAWLDVVYGYGLQRFFLDNFKVIAVLESRCEPWFDQAAVNTVVTILERCDSDAERDSNPVRFVKIKRPLAELIPWDMRLDGLRRWVGVDKLIQRITAVTHASDDPAAPHSVEDSDFRIRVVSQGSLHEEVFRVGRTMKWGRYLRSPQVYFDLLNQAGDKLDLLGNVAPPARGSLTGINEFYYLDDARIRELNLEPEFLLPLLKSPGESSTILIDDTALRLKVFVCRMTKDELREQQKMGALRYIEWGEKQVFTSGSQVGLTWPNGAEVKNRKPGWYALPKYRGRFAQIFFAQAYGDRHIQKYVSRPIIADARLYFLSPKASDIETTAAIMNSSLVALLTEVTGRVTMGDGALELKVEDARDYLYVPDPTKFAEGSQQAIRSAFQSLLQLPIGSVFEEIQKPDRQALDRAVLSAMGLDADQWLPRIYEGLSLLVGERMQLGKMRSQSRSSRTKRAAGRVAEDVLEEILPDGARLFPDEFLTPAARSNLRAIPLPEEPLLHRKSYFGKEELSTKDGIKILVENAYEARYVLYTQANGRRIVYLPERMVEVTRAVNEYVKYLRDLRQRLYVSYFRRALDQSAANRFVDETWRRYNLPDIQE
jgi:hypothetical protein